MKSLMLAVILSTATAEAQSVPVPPEVKSTLNLQVATDEWNIERAKCLSRLKAEFGPWMDTPEKFEAFRQMIDEWDRLFKKTDSLIPKSPWKALYYAQLENTMLHKQEQQKAKSKPVYDREANEKLEAWLDQQKAIDAAQAQASTATTDSQAPVQEVIDHYHEQAQQGRESAEKERQALQGYDRERRLQDLEKDEHDRLNRERSPFGN